MDEIKRFTTEFIPHEDRIRLSLESNDGAVRLLWLTRRLCVRLIPQIAKVLEQRAKLYANAMQAPSNNAQRRRQMNALGKLESQEPVRAGAGAQVEQHLVTMLAMRMTAQAILIDFKVSEDSIIQTIPFPEEAIRQWVVMLNACFRKGGWDDDVWPAWLALKGKEEGADPVRLN